MKTTVLLLALLGFSAGAMAQIPAPTEAKEARAILADLAEHHFSAVEQRFDPRVRAALPEEKLAAVWSSIEGQVGKFEAVRGVVVSGETVKTVTLVCHFERADLDTVLNFNASGQVIGLFFRPHEEGHWTAPSYAQPEDFTERPVTVTTGRWHLPGTLTVPKGKGPFPGVVLVQGSGPQDEDETIGPNKPFKDLAWGLASRGIAVLRYVKRTKQYGAASIANPATFTVDDETDDDAVSAVALLAHQPEVDPHRVFLLGHSLGATMAPRVAKGDPQIAGIIVMAGAVTPIEKLALDQVKTIMAREHAPAATAQKQIATLEAEVKEIESPNLKPGTMVKFLGAEIPSSYWLNLRGYHPDRVAATLHIPILVLQGGRDYQVPPSDFAIWKKTLAGHKNVTFDLFPDLNHLFISGTGPSTPAEYFQPGHVAEPVITEIASWVQASSRR
jgi:dienelactone hydrolase